MAGLYHSDFVDRLQAGAKGLLTQWKLAPETEVRLLSLSENATFRADDPGRDSPVILRVHRPNYHSESEIASELAWIAALRQDGAVETPAPLPMADGNLIARFEDDGQIRHVVAFDFMPGQEPDPEGDLAAGFETLGAISARLHAHTRTWTPPAGFTRKTWNHDTAFGADPLWGDWRAALGLTADGRKTLERLSDALRDRLAAYGAGPDRFGLVHADLRLANLLVDGDRLGVIDFDDCGFSWFIYDFAAAISFLETNPIVPDLQEAWVRGYRSVAALSDEHVEMIPTFIMFRRLLLTAWIASHRETETAREAGLEAYTQGTLDLAEAYLNGGAA
ncbi:Ser/Thr protein kinase RdoA (MazF antagonist) [Rhodovulum adriaticum]|uniref:Ser/Thr protein kinase RdoA (MazF antagonist) n=1 Tax=Rhodovulum adriaticum TaxID=35804 RepID=A0A4R2NIK0_RHOAD|nr:aminoglycoside phosphotransferase [Rhodovulum adriaticum]TCP21102.1 Ser/Thr protein kinase RdoA (MazF antagonist) [Rhodovulum adriaticum]